MSEPVREILPETALETDGAPQAETGAAPEPAVENAPLHWHNFLVKFMLWIAAAYHLFQCVWIFSGRIYFSAAVQDAIYEGIPAMFYGDHILAACTFAAAALQLLARTALSRHHARGPKMLAASYLLLLAGWCAYALTRWFAAGLSPLSLPILAQILSWLCLLLVNRAYYRKRRALFCSNDD